MRSKKTALRACLLGFSILGSWPAAAAGLSAGGYHAVRVNAGFVQGLGDGTYGQLGTNPAGTPATVAGLTNVTDVAAGGFTTIALKSDGTVWFLGESTVQHTTPHGTPNAVATPVQVAGLSGIEVIEAGHRHYLALDTDTGDLYGWGHNGSGQVGDGGLLDVTTPVVVLGGVASMAAGDGFSLAVKTDDTLWSWGRNTHGQLGHGGTLDRLTPTQVPGVTTADAVAAGGHHALILLNGGTILAVGNNSFGQLGLGTTTSTSTPTAVPGLSGITAICAGSYHSASLGAGQVSVWGRNFEGQCGGGGASPVTYPSPTTLGGLPATPTAISCGYHFTLVDLADGSVAGTGSNGDGQLDGTSLADQDDSQKVLAPVLVPIGPDVVPPAPDPMTFAVAPVAFDATTITMTATTATDLSEPVEYFFDCTTAGGNDSGWQSATTYADTGLVTGVEYFYQVKARDAALNETMLSAPASAVAMADTTAPLPDPMSFAVMPAAIGPDAITMTASTATDANGVEYFFENTAGAGNDSGWQDSPTYTDTGLAPGGSFSYRVQARDKSGNQNPTAFSASESASTPNITVILETDFTGRTVSGKTASTIPWTVGGIQDPGDLTWALEGGGPTGTNLFDTANAQGHFAPDLNIGNEGPWSVTIPFVLTTPQLQLDDVALDWQHFNNSGNFQTASRSGDWTVTVTGSTSGVVGTVTASAVGGTSGQETLVFSPSLTLTDAETYDLKIEVTGTDTNGNNTGLDGITVNGSGSVPDTTQPQVTAFSPADDATAVAVDADLLVTFDEPIMAGAGAITLRESAGGALVESFDVTTSPGLLFDGATVTINPASDLALETGYYVEIDAAAVEDLAGNDFAGISGATTWNFTTASAPTTSLIAHYKFDVDNAGTTPDAIGSHFATLGDRVQITTTGGIPMVGAGVLEMLGAGDSAGPIDGAVTSNNFSWANDARTITFWWRARTPNVDENDGTFISFGDTSANGTRFDIKEQGVSGTQLRVEVQGHGANTTPAIDDGTWHFIAVTVPDSATFADIAWYVDGSATDLNPSTNTLAIATGTGPMAFGDSILTVGSDTRVPDGYLDDVQVYDKVLDQADLLFLFNNPGSVIGPPNTLANWIAGFALGGLTGFDDDFDLDGNGNALENFFGTDPSQFSGGLVASELAGNSFSFTHPQSATPADDIAAAYEWSIDLDTFYADGAASGGITVSFSAVTDTPSPGITTVTATITGGPVPSHLFVRLKVTQN